MRRSKPYIDQCESPRVRWDVINTPLRPFNDDLEEALEDLEDIGVVESFIGEDGKVWYKLTAKGREIGESLDDAGSS